MGFRFRKSIKILPGVRLNVSTRGISTTVGRRGLSVNVSKRGTYLNAGIPGTGLSSRTRISGPSAPPPAPSAHEWRPLGPRLQRGTTRYDQDGRPHLRDFALLIGALAVLAVLLWVMSALG